MNDVSQTSYVEAYQLLSKIIEWCLHTLLTTN